MVILEAASCSGAGAMIISDFPMKVKMALRGTIEAVAISHPGSSVLLEYRHRGGDRIAGCSTRAWCDLEFKVRRPASGRGSGWTALKRTGMGAVMIAARWFGAGRGSSRPNISTPRRPVQGEDSSSSDESLLNEDIREGTKSEVLVDTTIELQDQFNRFAAAVALADRKMAEDIIREMGDGKSPSISSLDFSDEETLDITKQRDVPAQSLEDLLFPVPNAVTDGRISLEEIMEEMGGPVQGNLTKNYVEEIADLERQLEELYDEVGRMIDEGDEDTARDLIEANYQALSEQLETGVHGVEQAAMLDVLAHLYMDMGDYGNAQVLLDKTKELLKHVHSPQLLLDSVLEHVASMYSGMGKPEEAIPLYIQSLDMQRRIYGKDSHLLVTTMLGLAKAYCDSDEGSIGIELYQQVLILMERSKGHEDESLVLPLTHLGNTLLEEARVQEAEFVLRRAMMLTERAYGAGDGRVGVASCALARAKTAQGEVDEAVGLYRRGLEIMKGCSRFSSDDPVVEVVRTDLAELLNVVNRDSEAQELWEENLHAKERVLGKNDIQLVPHLHNVATSYAHSGKFDKCEPMLRRSLKLMSIYYGPRAPQISIPLELLATSLHHLGRGFEAEALAREAVSIRKSHYGEFHPTTGEAYNCLAAILHGLEKDDEAEQLLCKVLTIQEQELGPDCPEIILTLELLAMLLHEQGRNTELRPIICRMQKLQSALKVSTDSSSE